MKKPPSLVAWTRYARKRKGCVQCCNPHHDGLCECSVEWSAEELAQMEQAIQDYNVAECRVLLAPAVKVIVGNLEPLKTLEGLWDEHLYLEEPFGQKDPLNSPTPNP